MPLFHALRRSTILCGQLGTSVCAVFVKEAKPVLTGRPSDYEKFLIFVIDRRASKLQRFTRKLLLQGGATSGEERKQCFLT